MMKKEIITLQTLTKNSPTQANCQKIRSMANAYRCLLKYKARRFKQVLHNKMYSAAEMSPKEWWSLLKEIKTGVEWQGPENHVSIQALTAYFKSLYTADQPTEPPTDRLTTETTYRYSPNIDSHRNNLPAIRFLTQWTHSLRCMRSLKSFKASPLVKLGEWIISPMKCCEKLATPVDNLSRPFLTWCTKLERFPTYGKRPISRYYIRKVINQTQATTDPCPLPAVLGNIYLHSQFTFDAIYD